jgi:hypothetical protein
MKDERLPKIVLLGQSSRAKLKAGCLCLGLEDIIKKDLKEMGTLWAGVKRESLNRIGWRRSMHSCVGLKQFGAVVSEKSKSFIKGDSFYIQLSKYTLFCLMVW